MSDPTPAPSTAPNTGLRLAAVLLAALAVSHLVAALRYPLGSDPSLFQYHAWAMTQGVMPYRDSMEFNSPGILLLHLAFTTLFGFSDAALIAIAVSLSAAAVLLGVRWLGPRVSPQARLIGAAVALLAFTAITPWDRAQRELFQGLFLVAAVWAASRNTALSALGAGVLAGLAVLIKWPLVVLVWPLWALWLLSSHRAPRGPKTASAGARAVLSSLGFLLPLGGCAGWLAGNDALGPFLAIQRLVLPAHLGAMNAPWAELWLGRWPLAAILLGVLSVWAANRPSATPLRRPEGTAATLLMLGFLVLGVVGLYVLQGKGWSYQLHTALPFVAPMAGLLAERLIPPRRLQTVTAALVVGVALQVGLATVYDHTTGLERGHHVGGHWDHDAMEAVATLLRQGDSADTVLTNDDELQLLMLARRRAATPFIYGFLCSEAHPDEGLRRLGIERVNAVHRTPPTWVVWNTKPFRPELDALEANPTLASLLRNTCRELADAPAPYRMFRCVGSMSEPSLDGRVLQGKELQAQELQGDALPQ